jgi:hypothetical protein
LGLGIYLIHGQTKQPNKQLQKANAMSIQNFDNYTEDDFQKDFESGSFYLRTEEELLQESEKGHKVWDDAVYNSRAEQLGIQFQPLSESRSEEASLLAHGLDVRSVQEWYHGEEAPSPEEQEKMGAVLRLVGGAWVLTR